MILDELEDLLNKSCFDKLQSELNKNVHNHDLYLTFENGETLFHRLMQKNISEKLKINIIYKLSDAGLDINVQNKVKQQTCLHLAVIEGLADVVYCLLKNGADLTITDHLGLCAYNYARRLEDKDLSKKIISKMQFFYPTYWIGVDNMDINIIRKLVNSWCRFKIRKNDKHLIMYTREKNFKSAYELFLSLETQMEFCWAVLANNLEKVQFIIENQQSNLKMNFKNMKENNATIFYYAIKQNNLELLKTVLKLKQYILAEYMTDELDIDYPVYFTALKYKINEDCLKLLTPNLNELKSSNIDISCLFYKGMSLLRYSIEVGLDIRLLESLMNQNYCSRELITIKDPEYLTCKEYALKLNKTDYVNLIDKITIDYILNSKRLRMQLALNGFDFFENNLLIDGKDLLTYSKENDLNDLILFLENVELYQKKINEFHSSVEKNDYYSVKYLYKLDFGNNQLNELFILNLINSKTKNESQTVLFKAVLNGYYEIMNLILDLMLEEPNKNYIKLDQIRDHCFRTPMHYACGYNDNKKTSQLLSQFGFSDNVFDKDGMTPLDFQERMNSEEVQELITMHKLKKFTTQEPNPWSWQVWTRIQREKDTLKQLISVNHPHLHSHSHHHAHTHAHAYSHDIISKSISNETNTSCKIL